MWQGRSVQTLQVSALPASALLVEKAVCACVLWGGGCAAYAHVGACVWGGHACMCARGCVLGQLTPCDDLRSLNLHQGQQHLLGCVEN